MIDHKSTRTLARNQKTAKEKGPIDFPETNDR